MITQAEITDAIKKLNEKLKKIDEQIEDYDKKIEKEQKLVETHTALMKSFRNRRADILSKKDVLYIKTLRKINLKGNISTEAFMEKMLEVSLQMAAASSSDAETESDKAAPKENGDVSVVPVSQKNIPPKEESEQDRQSSKQTVSPSQKNASESDKPPSAQVPSRENVQLPAKSKKPIERQQQMTPLERAKAEYEAKQVAKSTLSDPSSSSVSKEFETRMKAAGYKEKQA